MKIAIRGHESRGKEVIQTLESLGGVNKWDQTGECIACAYYIDTVGNIYSFVICGYSGDRKIYTIEEFEKEFPFKIGDKVKHITSIGTIRKYCYIDNKPGYEVESMELGIIATIPAKILEPYKEMERNITLTLEKAKEWYKKGGELKEVALQAYSENELNPLPKSWDEFCRKYEFSCLSTRYANMPLKYDALIKLEQLRNCWRQGWKPKAHESVYAIKFSNGGLSVYYFSSREFLSFPTKEMAEEFLECFRDLIEKARDFI